MKKWKYKLCLWKAYFDTGYGWTSYFKWMIAFYILAAQDVGNSIYLGIGYGVFCFLFGWFLYWSGIILAQAEVGNQYNLFQRELRKKFSIPKSLNR